MGAIIHLVRHGEVYNPRKVRYGRLPGFLLSDAGKRQAERAAAYLGGLAPHPRFIVSSPLERAVQTATILRQRLLPGSELRLDERLLEATSSLDGLPRKAPVREIWKALRDPRRDARTEPPAEVAARMKAAIVDAAAEADGGSVVLVSHQSPIGFARAALLHELGDGGAGPVVKALPWAFRGLPCSYASVSSYELSPDGRARLVSYWSP